MSSETTLTVDREMERELANCIARATSSLDPGRTIAIIHRRLRLSGWSAERAAYVTETAKEALGLNGR